MAEALHREFGTGPRTLEERAQSVLELLPEALNAYADIGRTLADAENTTTVPSGAMLRNGAKAGSSSSYACPCGSGKQYRACCGSIRRLH